MALAQGHTARWWDTGWNPGPLIASAGDLLTPSPVRDSYLTSSTCGESSSDLSRGARRDGEGCVGAQTTRQPT